MTQEEIKKQLESPKFNKEWDDLQAFRKKKEKEFTENCKRFWKIFDGWENLTWAERRDRINNFRCGG